MYLMLEGGKTGALNIEWTYLRKLRPTRHDYYFLYVVIRTPKKVFENAIPDVLFLACTIPPAFCAQQGSLAPAFYPLAPYRPYATHRNPHQGTNTTGFWIVFLF